MIAEGPFGAFTTAARRRPRVALIAGGVGITPIRALLEDMPGGPGDIAVVYRALGEEDVILRAELDELAARRGAEVHYVYRRAALARAPARAGARHRGARRLRLRLAGDDRGDAREPRPHRRLAAPHRHRAVRVLMPKVIVALLVTAVAVVLLAGYDTKPPRTVNPNSALKPRPQARRRSCPRARGRRSARRRSRRSRSSRCRRRSQHGKLIGVKTVRADRRRPAHRGAQRARRADAARVGAEGGERRRRRRLRRDLHQPQLEAVLAGRDRQGRGR